MRVISIDVDTAVEVPVNIMPLTDDTDFKTRETAIAYNQAGMDLVWNFITSAGVITQTAVTPTTAGDYDWTHVGDGMYKIEIPASGGASINNDTEGYGYFTGICTGVLAWRSPTFRFRAAGLNDLLTDSAYSATRGLAGTALPAAAADGAGGLPISDAGGLDLDTRLGYLTAAAATASALATAQADLDTLTGADGATLATSQPNYAPATAAALSTVSGKVDTAQADLDILTGTDGATLATSQPNYAPATASALSTVSGKVDTAQADLDLLTGADGATLATSQPNYTPATASALTTVDTVVDAIKVVTDALGASAATLLAKSAGSMVAGTVDTATNSHTPTTTEFQADDITEATADHFNGRIVIFLTGALASQATDITDYSNVGGIGQFTVTAMTEAPANNDTFIIV